ncbi:uncharacterized protein [Epargyreus clarus]|uniref:uncharacterized protein n=1 Tax=Epargyreus clarus TaxID=520877 RepID=UPI003C2B5152
MAISLDIVNAFNTLPWKAIREALVYHQVPPYLRDVLTVYLSNRSVSYPGRYGSVGEKRVVCGVPQGSVLGPLLWNLAYDVVLRTELPRGVSVICYADDTLVLAEGETFEGTTRLAELGVARVVAKIRGIGLSVAENKTDALWFHGLRRGVEPPCMSVRVGDAVIEVGTCMRLSGCRRHAAKLNAAQRMIAIRVARGYRTISYEAATVLARFPSLDILADMTAEIFFKIRSLRQGGHPPNAETVEVLRTRASWHALRRWRDRLQEPRGARQRVVRAILPSFRAWLKRKKRVTYRLTQHTLEDCPAWQPKRQILVQNIGPDLSPETVVAAMLITKHSTVHMDKLQAT